MASSSKEIQESIGLFPPIQFGDLSPDILIKLMNQTPSEPPPTPSGPPPLPPQLWFSLRPKPPKSVSRPSSRRVLSLPPPPPTVMSAAKRSYVAVPSHWCVGNIASSRLSYLSGDPLLPKMFSRTILCRKFGAKEAVNVDLIVLFAAGIEILGPPVDYRLTFPLKPLNRPESAQPPPLDEEALSPDQEFAHAWASAPVKCTRNTFMSGHVGTGPPPGDGLPFPWVTDIFGSKFRTLENLSLGNMRKIDGFVECQKCRNIMGLGYLLPARYFTVLKYIHGKKEELQKNSEKVLGKGDFHCKCNGNMNPTVPIISEDGSKINWLFLFLGYGLGHCTLEQLRYFFDKRKYAPPGTKNQLLLMICADMILQLDPNLDFKGLEV